MLREDQNPFNKHIMAAILGVPNAGKSSLVNKLLGFDLSIVSNKPQTTRNHFHCVFTIKHTEVVLVDTPGIHVSSYEINKRMNGQAMDGAEGADINFLLIDLTANIDEQIKTLVSLYKGELKETWVIFTKSDLVKVDAILLLQKLELVKKHFKETKKHFVISSLSGNNIDELRKNLESAAQDGPHLYPNGDVSNKNERFFVTEYIREQAFRVLKEEVPYELAVVIDEYKDFRDKEDISKLSSMISASIIVNRPSQRAIVVGSSGKIIKEIGTKAREKIEAMVGGQVHLNLHVKVLPKWFKNNFVLEEIGLPRVQGSARVWRKHD